ncbi:MAG TPA: hypothetical protein VNY80_15335 [Steroidobacteraceae bacterium]|nr:hypothetical protein [Steroidobacteraceae bacterium]
MKPSVRFELTALAGDTRMAVNSRCGDSQGPLSDRYYAKHVLRSFRVRRRFFTRIPSGTVTKLEDNLSAVF